MTGREDRGSQARSPLTRTTKDGTHIVNEAWPFIPSLKGQHIIQLVIGVSPVAKLFISFSSKDTDFARLLAERLKAGGHEILADFDMLAPGQNWRTVLASGLKEADALVALVSEASLSSQYTLMEIG